MEDVANIAQIAGLDCLKLIAAIVTASKNARMHKKNCKNFAQHLKLIGDLLEQLKISDLREHPETSEPLERLEESLRKAYVLVNSCKNNSYLYLLAMGWNIVSQFKARQAEIDRLLHLIPLITLVENNRAQKHLRDIRRDQKDYSLDEEEERLQQAVLKDKLTESEAKELQISVSQRYPGLDLDEALGQENKKLREELERMQSLMEEPDQRAVIQHLIDITETDVTYEKDPAANEYKLSKALETLLRRGQPIHSSAVLPLSLPIWIANTYGKPRESGPLQRWHHGLYGCCWDPLLCISTFVCPCCAFATIAATATDDKMCKMTSFFSSSSNCKICVLKPANLPCSSASRVSAKRAACMNCLIYSIVLGCCFYTCCFRRTLRKRYNIEGGSCDDCWAHFLCFCCALVQEGQEIKARARKESASQKKMVAPPEQGMQRE